MLSISQSDWLVMGSRRHFGQSSTASVAYVVPLTATGRGFHSEFTTDADDFNGLDTRPSAQCRHLPSVSYGRIVAMDDRAIPSQHDIGRRRALRVCAMRPGDGRIHVRVHT